MSPERFLTSGMPFRRSEIAFWNSSEAAFTPKSRRLLRNSPACVANVVICLLNSPSSSWWYVFERSNLLNVQMWRLIMIPEIFPILPSNREGNPSGMETHTWNVKLNVIMPSASAE